jgi:phenylpropionate dioxygenase-like ring-hydroxylating dioxygenase large terminal subunit
VRADEPEIMGQQQIMGQHQITGIRVGDTRFPHYDAAITGFDGYWYPVLLSRQLGHKLLSMRLFGDDVLFIREKGRVYAWQDRCPHRGIKLSIGKREFPGTVSCRYHGWTFDLASGKLVAALTDGPDSPLCGRVGVKTFPAAERAGLIWIYKGDGPPPPLERDIPSELLSERTAVEGRVTERAGDWRHAAENGFDEGHGKYLHRDALFVTFMHPPAYVHCEVVPEEENWIGRKTKDYAFQADYPNLGRWPKKYFFKSSKVLSRASIRLPCVLRIRFARWTHFEWYVPSDPGRHRYVQVVVQNGGPLRRGWFHVRYWAYLRWLFHGGFNDQDARVVEMMQTPPEHLYRPDLSIIGWRKLCESSQTERLAGQAPRKEQV